MLSDTRAVEIDRLSVIPRQVPNVPRSFAPTTYPSTLLDLGSVEIEGLPVSPWQVRDVLRRFASTTYLPSTPSLESRWPRVEDVELITPNNFTSYIEYNYVWWLYLTKSIEQHTSVEHSIYTRYYDINRVEAIYMQSLPQVRNVFVLLRQDHYDDELMDHLLDREEKILDLYPEELFNFQYLPLLESDRTRLVPRNATLILSR
jgi:hypothetical protein